MVELTLGFAAAALGFLGAAGLLAFTALALDGATYPSDSLSSSMKLTEESLSDIGRV